MSNCNRLTDDAAFVDCLSLAPMDRWEAADKVRLLTIAVRATHVAKQSYVPSAPTGWKLVPIQPTEAMVLAGIEAAYESVDGTRGVIRNAILAAPEYRCEPQL